MFAKITESEIWLTLAGEADKGLRLILLSCFFR